MNSFGVQVYLAAQTALYDTFMSWWFYQAHRPFSELNSQLTRSKVPQQWQASDGQRMLADKQEKQEKRVKD